MTIFPTCDFPLIPEAEVIDAVRAALQSQQPLSLIRLGDGEAILMSLGDDSWLQDVAYLHGHWGSEQVTLGAVNQVRRDLEAALDGADLIGVRDDIVHTTALADLLDRPAREIQRYVLANFRLRDEEVDNLSAIGARRLALLQRVLSQREWSDAQRFCSAWIHWDLMADGGLDRLLDGVEEIGLVTSRPEIEQLVARRFGVATTAMVVPDKFVDSQQAGEHVPRRYRTLRSEMRFAPGTLVLVGAGIPGKVYCQWLKESGCIALDIGAVFDVWAGRATRPRILQSRFGVTGGASVPTHLQLPQAVRPDGRRVIPRWRSVGTPT